MSFSEVESAVEAVCGRGGVVLGSLEDGSALAAESATFVAVLVEEHELLPALVRASPGIAVGLLVSSGVEPADESGARKANALFERLGAWRPDTYVLNIGSVGGEPGQDRSRQITTGELETLIDAARRGVIEWETDPDFGWEHPSRIVEVGVMDDSVGPIAEELLCPRYLYAYGGSVYDYAARVPELKAERRKAASRLAGIDPAIDLALAGPEPVPHKPGMTDGQSD